ncbi:dolichol kinase [Hypoxylon texense]
MPADDYVSIGGGGALKLKGGKVQKTKKKKKSKTSSLERSLSAEVDPTPKETERAPRDDSKDADEGAVAVAERKTEAERRHEEANRKKMMKMLEDPKLASEFRKTHKERVEGLNTYLSKLSEHHDMPKIGPG